MQKVLWMSLLALSCQKQTPDPQRNNYSCRTWVLVTKPGCPPSTDTVYYELLGLTQDSVGRFVRKNTFVEWGVEGLRQEMVTECELSNPQKS
jgi:hypothetical protein